MKARTKRALQFACYAILCSLAFAGDDAPNSSAESSIAPALDAEQQRAVDLHVAHPAAAAAPERTTALGVVLDVTSLQSDASELTVAEAEERAVSAEASRLRGLYQAGAGPSLKALETAEAEEAKARAAAELAAVRFSQHWGPLAKAGHPAAIRQRELDALISGRGLLVRAELPGQRIVGALPSRALLDVDGTLVPGRVLGPLTQYTESQSAAVLLQVDHPPLGLAAGTRIPLWLYGGERTGMQLPREAIVYDERGAYVYKQAAGRTAGEKTRYLTARVTLLMPYGDGWLVQGVDADDEIVVRGAGVLWSLEGVGARAADDGDED